MKVVILAGGLGTRLSEETSTRPKPMVEVGGRPMLWHIMHLYAAHGLSEFVLALGYKAEMVRSYFLTYHAVARDLTVHLTDGKAITHGESSEDWSIDLIDTGLGTQTGGRIRKLREWIGNDTFCLTYGDGVSNVDIGKLVAFHRKHGKLATVTAVRPPARFGGLELEGDEVRAFAEKKQASEGWINGGFFWCSNHAFSITSTATAPSGRRNRSNGSPSRVSFARSATKVSGSRWTRCATSGISSRCGPARRRHGKPGNDREEEGEFALA